MNDGFWTPIGVIWGGEFDGTISILGGSRGMEILHVSLDFKHEETGGEMDQKRV